MEQSFIEKILSNYDHLKGKYLGCFCKDQMQNLTNTININEKHNLHPKCFTLINTGELQSNGEHWMGLVINKRTNSCGYFDSFGCPFVWLEDTLKRCFKHVHKTNHVVQSETASTCGLHTIYFIIRMLNPMDKSIATNNVDVGNYVRKHYDMRSGNAKLKDKHIVDHLSKKFKTNFSMLLQN